MITVLLSGRFAKGKPFGGQTRFLFEAANKMPLGSFGVCFVEDLLSFAQQKGKAEQSFTVKCRMYIFNGSEFVVKSFIPTKIYDRFFAVDSEQKKAYLICRGLCMSLAISWHNTPRLIELSRNKWLSYQFLKRYLILTPESYFVPSLNSLKCSGEKVTLDVRNLMILTLDRKVLGEEAKRKWLKETMRGILKPCFGQKGYGIWTWRWERGLLYLESLGKDQGAESFLDRVFHLKDETSWIFQPDLRYSDSAEKEFSRELRLWMQRNENGDWIVQAAAERQAAFGHKLSNIEQGGCYLLPEDKGFFDSLPLNLSEYSEMQKQDRRVKFSLLSETNDFLDQLLSLLSGLRQEFTFSEFECCTELAIDLFFTKGEWSFLELNSKPGRSIDRILCEKTSELRANLVCSPFRYLLTLLDGKEALS